MKYTLTKPCDECPYLKSMDFSIDRLEEFASGQFACHKTCSINEETGCFEPNKKSVHCAGALIYLEKQNRSHQMMRIAERLGLYDHTKLDMDAKVKHK